MINAESAQFILSGFHKLFVVIRQVLVSSQFSIGDIHLFLNYSMIKTIQTILFLKT